MSNSDTEQIVSIPAGVVSLEGALLEGGEERI